MIPLALPTNTRRLADSIAIVTGAGCLKQQIGIGRAIAMTLAQQGAVVIAIDRDKRSADETVAMIESIGGKSMALQADVTDLARVEETAEQILHQFGTIDVLVNSVGGGKFGGALDTTMQAWTEALNLNLTSAFNCAKSVLPAMIRQSHGSIVNVGSLHATRYPGANTLGYCVAKAGLMQMSRCIAMEFANKGIRSNTLLVGAADTPEIRRRFAARYGAEHVDAVMDIRDQYVPSGRCASVWDVAHAAAFLASDESVYITGTELAVDGGASAATVPSYLQDAERLLARSRHHAARNSDENLQSASVVV